MFRNYAITALRNLVRNKLYAAINIGGLTLGFAAALLIALFVSEEFSYEHWIPGYERTYLVPTTITVAGVVGIEGAATGAEIAGWLKQDIPEIEQVARLEGADLSVRHGEIEFLEWVNFADKTFFSVLPLPVFRGDPATALEKPDSIVITRKIARKYFGREDVIGQTLELARQHPMIVTAVLQDLPSNTHLTSEIYAAGHAEFSPLAVRDGQPPPLLIGANNAQDLTYLRLPMGVRPETVTERVANAANRRIPKGGVSLQVTPRLTPIADVHFDTRIAPMRSPGYRPTVVIISVVGVLLLVISVINFVNLTTARAARRAVEVGVRKSVGALLRDLIIQFIGEGLLYIFSALACALALTAILRPVLNSFLDTGIGGDYWRHPMLVGVMIGLPLFVGALSAIYPALLVSAFRPAIVLKSGKVDAFRGFGLRRALVVVQFAVLVGLALAVTVITRQLHFAVNDAMRVDTDQVLTINTICSDAFRQEVAALPGVNGAACSNGYPSRPSGTEPALFLPSGMMTIWYTSVDEDFFDIYGLKPLAGRFLTREPADTITEDTTSGAHVPVVLNETAVRAMQLGNPTAAIGASFRCGTTRPTKAGYRGGTCEVAGVVPDYADESVHEPIRPAMYSRYPAMYKYLSVKLRGRDIPETLNAIDSLWRRLGEPRPISRTFVNQRMQDFYVGMTRQGQALTGFAGVALFIACLGLFGLSSYTAEARRKEIGIRKAMGASRADILIPMLWQFTKPVLWGCLIAWPIGYFVMRRWLEGFVYHVDLSPWLFLATGAAALVIALATVAGHALLVARAKPVTALRYE